MQPLTQRLLQAQRHQWHCVQSLIHPFGRPDKKRSVASCPSHGPIVPWRRRPNAGNPSLATEQRWLQFSFMYPGTQVDSPPHHRQLTTCQVAYPSVAPAAHACTATASTLLLLWLAEPFNGSSTPTCSAETLQSMPANTNLCVPIGACYPEATIR